MARGDSGSELTSSSLQAPRRAAGISPRPPQDRSENRFGSAPRAPFKPRATGRHFVAVPAGTRRRTFRQRRTQTLQTPQRSASVSAWSGTGTRGQSFRQRTAGPFKPRLGSAAVSPAPPRGRRRGGNRFGGAPRGPCQTRERPQFRPLGTGSQRSQATHRNRASREAKRMPVLAAANRSRLSAASRAEAGGFGKYRGNTRGGPKRSSRGPAHRAADGSAGERGPGYPTSQKRDVGHPSFFYQSKARKANAESFDSSRHDRDLLRRQRFVRSGDISLGVWV